MGRNYGGGEGSGSRDREVLWSEQAGVETAFGERVFTEIINIK